MATTKKNPSAKSAKRSGASAARTTGKANARSAARKGAAHAAGKRAAPASGKSAARSTAKSAGKTRTTARAGLTKRASAATARSPAKTNRAAARKAVPAKTPARGAGTKPKSTPKPQKMQKAAKIKTVKDVKGSPAAATASKASAPSKAQKPAAKPAHAPAAQPPKLKVVGRGAQPATGGAAASAKPAAPKAPAPTANGVPAHNFQVGDHVVYPSHGVGKITGIESHTIGEQKLQMFVISFEKERMTLRVPVAKISTAGMRRLSSPAKMDAAVTALKGRARARRVMWSRRAQEYEAKLNSGDPVSIAEVVRDLHRNVGQPDQSYSERQMYEAALERLAREFAAVEKIDTDQAAERLEKVLRAA